ncbi:MAG: hypothetical protein ABW021_08185 [Acidimicrobiia bacterium]
MPTRTSVEDGERELITSLYPALRRIAGVAGSVDVEPDDLVQEALMRVLRRGCKEGATGPEGTVVTWSIDVVIDVSEALGLQPGTASYTFVVEDDQIRSANPHLTDLRGLQEASDTFLAWMRLNTPKTSRSWGRACWVVSA